MTAALPLPAKATPELMAMLHQQKPEWRPEPDCTVTLVRYMNDEGGIVCRLDFGVPGGQQIFASLTHLRFDAALPVALGIAEYQLQRIVGIKGLRG